jgi:hypothetical protein
MKFTHTCSGGLWEANSKEQIMNLQNFQMSLSSCQTSPELTVVSPLGGCQLQPILWPSMANANEDMSFAKLS